MSPSSLVVCDAGPLIALGKLNRLHLLADLYSEVHIPHAVYSEVVTQGLRRGSSDAETVRRFWQYQGWPVVRVSPQQIAAYHPPVILGTGEIEVLILAQSAASELVLLDDEVARSEARRLGLQVKGTVGIIISAYRSKLLTISQTELLLQEIAQRPDIWISRRLCEAALSMIQSQPEV